MLYKFAKNVAYGVTVIRLSNGSDALYLDGECLACAGIHHADEPVTGTGKRIVVTLGVPFELLELPVPATDEWCWSDITDSLGWGKTVTLPAGCVVSENQLSTSHITREDSDILFRMTEDCKQAVWIRDTYEGFIIRPYTGMPRC